MNFLQRWRQTSIANKMLVITGFLMAVGTFFLAGAAVFQYLAMKEQAEITRNQLDTMKEQSNVVQRQLIVMQGQANSAREQTDAMKESLGLTIRAVNATEKQANTAQVSARAAERGATVAAQSLQLEQRPIVGIQSVTLKGHFAAGEQIGAIITLVNTGKTPAVKATFYGQVIFTTRSEPPQETSEPESTLMVLSPQARFPILVQFPFELNDQAITRFAKYHPHFLVWGHIAYSDISGRSYLTEFAFYSVEPDYSAFAECPVHNTFK